MFKPPSAGGLLMAATAPKRIPAPANNPDLMGADADEAARLLKMLANGQRLRVLCALVDKELSVSQINERVDLSQSALSQHLARLRAEGLVETRRESQVIYYRLRSAPAQRLIATLHDIYCGTRRRRR